MIYASDDSRHLVCFPYSTEGLHAMAEDLEIKRCWFHTSPYPHYDIPKKRIDEIRAKTLKVSSRDIISIIKGTYNLENKE